jgi:nucleoside-diphosphate-sugar epimerase
MGKIAITGAHNPLGQEVVKWVEMNGYSTVLIDYTDTGSKSSDSQTHIVDIANDYDGTVKAFTGCDAVIHLAATHLEAILVPVLIGKPGSVVHMNNVQAAFNCFRACGELGIKRICHASSFNAIGLAYTNQFKYFPIDEEHPIIPTDAYTLAQLEVEVQARAFVTWFPATRIACLRVHALGSKNDFRTRYSKRGEPSGVMNLWSGAHPTAGCQSVFVVSE